MAAARGEARGELSCASQIEPDGLKNLSGVFFIRAWLELSGGERPGRATRRVEDLAEGPAWVAAAWSETPGGGSLASRFQPAFRPHESTINGGFKMARQSDFRG